jgi:hypothetical protein
MCRISASGSRARATPFAIASGDRHSPWSTDTASGVVSRFFASRAFSSRSRYWARLVDAVVPLRVGNIFGRVTDQESVKNGLLPTSFLIDFGWFSGE